MLGNTKCVDDGPIDANAYRKASIRVLHLLKQPTEYTPSLPALFREKMEEDDASTLIKRVAERSYCIQNNGVDWQALDSLSKTELGNALFQSAVVNLQNAAFASSTAPGSLDEMA